MTIQLSELAEMVGGICHGDGSVEIHGAGTLEDARSRQITFVDQPERLRRLDDCPAVAAVVPQGVGPQRVPTIAVADVHAAFTRIVMHFHPPKTTPRRGVSPHAFIDPTARLSEDVEIHAGATIGPGVRIACGATIHSGVHIMAGSEIGEQVTIMPGAVLYQNTRVGPRVTIHACAVLGSFGFGYQTVGGRHERSAQLGYVQIGADVEIGACTTIDRGTYGPTVIGDGTKIDNQVMIAHNCRLGRHNMICSQVGIAGSTTTGDYVVMAGQVGVRDHVTIGDGAVLGAKAGVSNDVAACKRMIGIPATDERDQKLKQAVFAKLPEMRKQLRELQRVVEQLTSRGGPRGREKAA